MILRRYTVYQQLYPSATRDGFHANIVDVGTTRARDESEAIAIAREWPEFRDARKLARFPMVAEYTEAL